MEQKKEIDLTGFLLRAISMTDKALDDSVSMMAILAS